MSKNPVEQLKDLEKENARLRKLLAKKSTGADHLKEVQELKYLSNSAGRTV